MTKQINAVCTYDFTLKCEGRNEKIVKDYLEKYFKKWCFQKEEGKSGYLHFQGRGSLKVKKRLTEIPNPLHMHFSITSKDNRDNNFYVTKDEGRRGGPWMDTDEVIYIPRQIREIEGLYLWQEQIKQQLEVWDTRSINILYCPHGNIGKSTLVGYIRAYRLGRVLPPVNDYKDAMRMVCDMPTSRAYLFDMPRAQNKDKLYGFYTAIESIKDGYAWDDRYSFKEKVFDCPNIWVFTNTIPDENLLSGDRWKVWIVNQNSKGLEPYCPIDELDQ